jgi:hypothetical protein
VRAAVDPWSKRAAVDLGDILATADLGDSSRRRIPETSVRRWSGGEVRAAAASDPEGTHAAAAPCGAHDGEVATVASADPGGHKRGSVSLRCTRQRPLEVRTTVR